MLGAPTLAALLMQLAVRSDALSISQKDFDQDDMIIEDSSTVITDIEDSKLITDIDGPLDNITVNYNLEERIKMHKRQYEAEFVAMLNITKARETGEILGLQLCVEREYEPPKVCRVRRYGLVRDWNEMQLYGGNLEQLIIVGDEIHKVNQIEWHHNSKMFAKRISDQFFQSRKLGGRDWLELHVRRKKENKDVNHPTQIQREDRHKYLFAKEWEPVLTTAGVSVPSSDRMGWTLQHDREWEPVKVSSVKQQGLIFEYNKAHPEDKIMEGDEVVGVDGYHWVHNTKRFMEVMDVRIDHILDNGSTLKFHIRRPREVQDEYSRLLQKAIEKRAQEARDDDDTVAGSA